MQLDSMTDERTEYLLSSEYIFKSLFFILLNYLQATCEFLYLLLIK